MPKRKLRNNQKASDDEKESQRPAKQVKKQNSPSKTAIIVNRNRASTSRVVHDSGEDGDFVISGDAANDTHYESFSSFLKAFSYYCDENEDERRNSRGVSRITSNECEISIIETVIETDRGIPEEVSHLILPSQEEIPMEDLEARIKIESFPSKMLEIVLLKHPSSLTLHGYVKVSVLLGRISIFGYDVNAGENITVFSTESTGLKKLVTLKSNHIEDIENAKKNLSNEVINEDIDIEEFMNDCGRKSVLLVVKKISLPAPLQFLELYYPNALQTRWPKHGTSEEKNIATKEKNFELCSSQQSYVIDVTGDFEMLSTELNRVISLPVSEKAEFGPRILIRGEKNMGKSTLIRYLINSALNKLKEVYLLDTDPGQTEYTPPGVVSLIRVTKPLLGPSFAHQKKPLKMLFTGSVTAGTSPKLYQTCIIHLMKLFNKAFPKKTLFVNTMGWVQGMGQLCLDNIKYTVKPTIEIELVSPELQLTQKTSENGVVVIEVPSKAPAKKSGAPSYQPIEIRNFNLIAYFGQCQKSFLPLTLINSFHPVCVSWDKIAMYVMGKKVPAQRLVEAIHCSIVALCRVNLSYMLKSDNPDFPMTLYDEPICECLGFGLVRASDEQNHLFYIVTPLTANQLKNVNALVKGNIVIPDEIFLKQTILNKPLPFTNQLQEAKTPGLKAVPRRAFRNTLTPRRTP